MIPSITNWKIILLLCLTLGLAPYSPEPHIVSKIRWILGGAKGMAFMDWWDTFLHGLPWLLLLTKIVGWTFKRFSPPKTTKDV